MVALGTRCITSKLCTKVCFEPKYDVRCVAANDGFKHRDVLRRAKNKNLNALLRRVLSDAYLRHVEFTSKNEYTKMARLCWIHVYVSDPMLWRSCQISASYNGHKFSGVEDQRNYPPLERLGLS